jgi:hypothetical protein
MVEVASSKNATSGAFSPPKQSEGARRVQSPEAMAIEDNLAGPTKFISLCFPSILFFVFAQSSRVVATCLYCRKGMLRNHRAKSCHVREAYCCFGLNFFDNNVSVCLINQRDHRQLLA